jgi:hypothetical protein
MKTEKPSTPKLSLSKATLKHLRGLNVRAGLKSGDGCTKVTCGMTHSTPGEGCAIKAD